MRQQMFVCQPAHAWLSANRCLAVSQQMPGYQPTIPGYQL